LEDILASIWKTFQDFSLCFAVDPPVSYSLEFKLTVDLRRHKLCEEFRSRVDDLRGECEGVGSREGELLCVVRGVGACLPQGGILKG
jgi:hypothetical protein